MKQQIESRLFVTLRPLPMAVLELTTDGVVTAANDALLEITGRDPVQHTVRDYLDRRSWKRLSRILEADADAAADERCHLRIRTEDGYRAHTFQVLRGEEASRLVLLEISSPRAESSENGEELAATRRELEKNALRLARALEEIEEKLVENEALSKQLQHRNRELEAQNEELYAMTRELHESQDEMLRLNQQLERRSRELQIAMSGRNRFYASMSHELRTPVNAVMGYNDLLLAGVYGRLNEQQELAVERSQRAVRHLRELINDVLDMARIETGRLSVEVEDVNVSELLNDVLATLRPVSSARGVDIFASCEDSSPEVIRSDPRRVRQILMNLVTHAIRNGSGKPVWIRCEKVPPGGVAMEVVDNGRGFEPEELPSVFEEFPSAIGEELAGTGMGLSIAKRLVKLLGGGLEASSTRGVGSTFRLTLPDRPPSGGDSDGEPAPEAG